jgi:hypothetical protein
VVGKLVNGQVVTTSGSAQGFFASVDAYLKKEQMRFDELFADFDSDGNGTLDGRELAQLVKQMMGARVSDSQLMYLQARRTLARTPQQNVLVAPGSATCSWLPWQKRCTLALSTCVQTIHVWRPGSAGAAVVVVDGLCRRGQTSRFTHRCRRHCRRCCCWVSACVCNRSRGDT